MRAGGFWRLWRIQDVSPEDGAESDWQFLGILCDFRTFFYSSLRERTYRIAEAVRKVWVLAQSLTCHQSVILNMVVGSMSYQGFSPPSAISLYDQHLRYRPLPMIVHTWAKRAWTCTCVSRHTWAYEGTNRRTWEWGNQAATSPKSGFLRLY